MLNIYYERFVLVSNGEAMIETVIQSIVGGVIASLIASFLFWLLSFRISGIKIVFPDKIVYQKEKDSDRRTYRIKLYNVGRRELMEAELYGQITIKSIGKGNTHTYSARINVGIPSKITAIHGNRFRKTDKKAHGIYQTLSLNQESYREYEKELYTDEIRSKARNNTLEISDILEAYKTNAYITVIVFGYDGFTRRRELFISKDYYVDDIVCGEYVSMVNKTWKKGDEKEGLMVR